MSRATPSPADDSVVFVCLLAFRFLNSVTVRTFFQPDEYYQVLEPAWSFAYYGKGAWITWEWAQHLRSAIHPALFSAVYHAVNILIPQPKTPDLRDGFLLFAPKAAQAVIAALGDLYTWKLSKKVYSDSRLSSITLSLTALNPWQWFCSTRTFSNGLESTLTVAALYCWPFEWNLASTVQKAKGGQTSETTDTNMPTTRLRKALFLAATATIIRPTNLLIWIVLACDMLFRPSQPATPSSKETKSLDASTFISRFKLLAREGVICGGAMLVVSAITDRAFYGVWTFPAANFLYFNVVQSLAVFYGNNDWHYYLSQGYPLLLTTALPFALLGIYKVFSRSPSYQRLSQISRKSLRCLAIISIVLPAALSVLSHKEVRFIYPLLGPLLVIATAPVSEFFGPVFYSATQTSPDSTDPKFLRSLLLVLLVSTNLLIAGYTTLIHNSGIIALPEYIRTEFITHYASTTSASDSATHQHAQNLTFAVFMPCHSIPWRSHLLNPPTLTQPGIQAWALTCEPPLHLTDPAAKSTYLDEADIFYSNPTLWLRRNMSPLPPSSFKHPNQNPLQPPGIYTDPSAQRNKHLWKSIPQPHDTPTSGFDITDLLPYLQTAPSKTPRIETEDLPRRPWPHYLAFFAQLEPTLTQALRGSGYAECWRVFNSHWHDDWRRTGDVVVWCLFPERAHGESGHKPGIQADNGARDNGKNEDQSEEKMTAPERPGTQRIVRPGG